MIHGRRSTAADGFRCAAAIALVVLAEALEESAEQSFARASARITAGVRGTARINLTTARRCRVVVDGRGSTAADGGRCTTWFNGFAAGIAAAVLIEAAEQTCVGRIRDKAGKGNGRYKREDTFHRSNFSAKQICRMPMRAESELQKYWSHQPEAQSWNGIFGRPPVNPDGRNGFTGPGRLDAAVTTAPRLRHDCAVRQSRGPRDGRPGVSQFPSQKRRNIGEVRQHKARSVRHCSARARRCSRSGGRILVAAPVGCYRWTRTGRGRRPASQAVVEATAVGGSQGHSQAIIGAINAWWPGRIDLCSPPTRDSTD